MPDDTVMNEMHRIKEQIAEQHGNDLRAIAEAAKAARKGSGKPAVRRPPKRVSPK